MSIRKADSQCRFAMPIRPLWKLLDAAIELAEPVCFLLNEFIKTETFPAELKRADIIPLSKKETGMILKTIDQFR